MKQACSVLFEHRMQQSSTALSLLGTTIEQVRAQRVALADLRQQLEDRSWADGASETFPVLARCLAYEAFAHELELWEICRAWMAPSRPSLAPYVERLCAEQEDYLGLLGFAVRTTAVFLGAEDASIARRALLASLGVWVSGQRSLLRSEREGLVPALQALDPAPAPDASSAAAVAVVRHGAGYVGLHA